MPFSRSLFIPLYDVSMVGGLSLLLSLLNNEMSRKYEQYMQPYVHILSLEVVNGNSFAWFIDFFVDIYTIIPI